jgi:hypothetical protein
MTHDGDALLLISLTLLPDLTVGVILLLSRGAKKQD